jgi:hypothetical protein
MDEQNRDDEDLICLGQISKLKAVQDNRDAEYFNKLLARKDQAVQEYSTIHKAIQRQKIKSTNYFKNPGNKELFDKFDSVPT